MWFWESFTLEPLGHPPDLTSYSDLTLGDLYFNVVKGDRSSFQLWSWVRDGKGVEYWKRAREGDTREDGRRLTISPKRQQPGWVSPDWGVKVLRNPNARKTR